MRQLTERYCATQKEIEKDNLTVHCAMKEETQILNEMKAIRQKLIPETEKLGKEEIVEN